MVHYRALAGLALSLPSVLSTIHTTFTLTTPACPPAIPSFLLFYHHLRHLYIQPLEFELDDGPAIEALLGAYPAAVSISELPHPSEEEEDKLEVAQALYKEGFLMIHDDASKPSGAVDRDGGGSESDDSDAPF